LTKISIFDHNFGYWEKFLFFLTESLIFCQHFDFWLKFRCWPKFGFLTKIFIFDHNFDFWPKFWFLTIISIFQNSDFCRKLRFLSRISIFITESLQLNFLTKTATFSFYLFLTFFIFFGLFYNFSRNRYQKSKPKFLISGLICLALTAEIFDNFFFEFFRNFVGN